MKITMIKFLCLTLAFYLVPSQASWFYMVSNSASSSEIMTPAAELSALKSPAAKPPVINNPSKNELLRQRFSQQHQQLIPVVAVANMFYMCNKVRKVEAITVTFEALITTMDKGILAEKLSRCLGSDTVQSNIALNFGLLGCFYDQVAYLPEDKREIQMQRVRDIIAELPIEERKKSFTQCVTEQSIHYLK